MTLTITTNSNLSASLLAEDILRKVSERNVETWKYNALPFSIDKTGRVSNTGRRYIYHDTEQTKQDKKILWFFVSKQESDVIFTAHIPNRVELTRQEELFLLGRLSEMLICNFSERFSSIQIEW